MISTYWSRHNTHLEHKLRYNRAAKILSRRAQFYSGRASGSPPSSWEVMNPARSLSGDGKLYRNWSMFDQYQILTILVPTQRQPMPRIGTEIWAFGRGGA